MENVYEDSVTSPFRVKVQKGTDVSDKWLSRVRCVDNEAEFTVTGGRNNMPVRVDGFTSPATYGFSFIVEQESPKSSASFRVVGSTAAAGGDA